MAKLKNIENLTSRKNIFSIFWFIIKEMWRVNKLPFLATIFVVFVMVGIQFLNNFGFGQIINILASGNPTWSKIIPFLILIVLCDYIPWVFSFMEASLTEYLDRSLRLELEQKIFSKLSTLDIATIEQPDFQDILYQVQSRGISGVIAINFWLFTLIRQGFRVVISLSILFALYKLGLIILVISCIPIYFYEKWRSRNLGKIFESQTETNRKVGSKIGAFTNKDALIEVKFFSLGSYFLNKIKAIRLEHHKHLAEDDKKTIPYFAGAQLFPQAGIMFSAVSIIKDVINGLRPIGTLTFVWSTLWQFSNGFSSIIRSIGRLEEHGTHASKLINLLNMESFVFENKNGIVINQNYVPTIEFKNVYFSYPGTDKEILKNINLTIKPEQEVALVGLNGAGKTTLLRLLTRVYDPTSGEILVDGINLKEYSLDSWRKTLGIMLQDYFVYQDESIKENITFNSNYNNDLLEQVTKDTGVLDYSKEYQHGLDQMIGKEYKGGIELSKGQKQKLVLSRTLYQNHSIIVLDEPTSAIDALSEDHIFKSIRENYKNKTRVIISHKFSNVRNADNIVLIENGEIIEEGNHDKLIESKGTYYELFNLQAEGYK